MNTKRIVQLASVVLLWTLVLVERGVTAAVAWAIVAAGIYGLIVSVKHQRDDAHEMRELVDSLNVETKPVVPRTTELL